ncbi:MULTISPECIES: response regulator [unclassified Treponema]|uniref:response regulator n=1 Tax=unclassified Treponema TaxID=2638727 RepID=UPI0020A3B3F5|nr:MULTISPECIES: response regulator [unclassified Treponema]UTC67401.1 response regulator [Treponema sp. OMZ 789]UTC70129.1 response regulator [Treponema sp. OMZ 790]UTC72844.1 response regulator [Treponema sp. OMZ 791]
MHVFNKRISNSRLGKYLIASNIGYIIFSPEYVPLFWSPEAEKLLPEYLVKNTKVKLQDYLKTILSEEDYIRLSEFIKTNPKTSGFEARFDSSSNLSDKTALKFSFNKQDDGNFFVTVYDITKQKLKEEFLTIARQDAEKANSMRSLFLANVSHEIRTPIQTIIGMMELINETNLDEEQSEYTRQVNFSAEVLLTLVNDVLDFSKLESGNMTMERTAFNLTDSVEQTVDLISMEAHKKGLEIVVDISDKIPDFIYGDPARLQQVLLNFVKNAVKFTEKGYVSVSVKLVLETKPNNTDKGKHFSILFEVADTGIGVNAEQKSKIFNSFYQGNAAINRKYGGTGLGLAISKNIITMMKGKIGIKDNIPGGSVFWFKIPLIPSKKKAPHESTLLDKSTRFLIVDDNMQTRSILKRMLFKFGFQDISLVSSGEHAIEEMKTAAKNKNPFKVVFIDMVMPKMDGWRLGAEIHNDPNLSDSKLFLMIPEGSLGRDAKMKLLEWFDGYLYKPVKSRIIFNLINGLYPKFAASSEKDDISELEPVEATEQNQHGGNSHYDDEDNFLGCNVLVVDDHPVNQKLLKIILEKAHCTVETANDGEHAIEAASGQTFDIIFMDIQMPGINGYEATQILRGKGYTNPIIACTAGSQDNERKLCESKGLNDIIKKPFNKKQLFEMVKKYYKR